MKLPSLKAMGVFLYDIFFENIIREVKYKRVSIEARLLVICMG